MQSGSVAQVNITAAALTAQVCLIAIMFIGAWIVRSGDSERPWRTGESTWKLAWIILPFTLLTVGPLVFSSEFAGVWKPLVGGSDPPVFGFSTAMLTMFVGDIVLVAWLSGSTGGSRNSPFAPIFFVLPALAIFLREPFDRVFWYATAIGTLFFVQLVGALFPRDSRESYVQAEVAAYGVVSVLCLMLATYIGFVTRPR